MPDDHGRPPGPGADRAPASHVSRHTPPCAPHAEPRAAAPPLRIVVADDNPVVRAGLTALLRGRPDLDVVAEAADGHEACAAAVHHRPDVVLLDVRMPRMDGLAALPRLARLAPVLMTTYSGESAVVHEALRRGAHGYLVHGEFTAEQLVSAVRDVRAGRAAFSRSAAGVFGPGGREGRGGPGKYSHTGTSSAPYAPADTDVQRCFTERALSDLQSAPQVGEFAQQPSLTQANVGHSSPGSGVVAGLRGVITELSRREKEVMELIASGMTNQQIAVSCFISPKTVKNHINRIFAKLNAASRGEAIAVWHGLARRGAGPA